MRGNVRGSALSLVCTLAFAVAFALACGDGGGTAQPAAALGPPPGTTVPEAGTFVKRTVTVGRTSYPYQVFVPAAYQTGTTWPVVMAIHGGQGRGTDGEREVQQGLALAVKAQAKTFPAFAVFPQIPPGEGFPRDTMIAIARAALDQVMQTYRIDATRQYLTGISFGGVLAYDLAYREPARYAALVPVSCAPNDASILGVASATTGSSYASVADRLRAVPMWIFHGRNDAQFAVSMPRAVVAAFQRIGVTVKYTEYPTGAHDGSTWDTAYATPELYTWMLAQHR
jgi:predicted peptidase